MNLHRALVTVIAMATLAGCAAGVENPADGTVTETLDGQRVRLDPALTESATGLAVWFHGQGGDADQRMNEDWLNSLREDGWAVASGDMQRTGWGNAASVSDAASLVEWAEQETGLDTGLFVAGSMGALGSLALMADGTAAPSCWYGIMPVVDLDTVSGVPNADEQIADAYGDDSPRDPSEVLEGLPADVAYRVLASPDDTWVPATENAGALVAATERSELVPVTGEHGDPSHFDGDDLATFAQGCK